MWPLSLERVRSVLLLGAHPDDIEIGCGGTVLELVAVRSDLAVRWVVLSGRGERAGEAERSARGFLAGVADARIEVHDFEDSFFPQSGRALKDELHRLAADVEPDLVLTHHREDLHQDHRVVSELTSCAFRDHLVLEYEIPKYDGDLGRPNLYVPIGEERLRRKVEAILDGFPSQRGKPWFDEETFRALPRLRGVECRSPSRFAEAFHCRKMTLCLPTER